MRKIQNSVGGFREVDKIMAGKDKDSIIVFLKILSLTVQ